MLTRLSLFCFALFFFPFFDINADDNVGNDGGNDGGALLLGTDSFMQASIGTERTSCSLAFAKTL